MPSVEPTPRPPSEVRRRPPDEAQEGSRVSVTLDGQRLTVACSLVLVVSALLLGWWYWALNEECARYDECSQLRPFIDQGKDDDVVRDKKKKAANPSKFKHWHGVMLGANGYLDATGNMELQKSMSYMDLNYARSFNIQINPIERQFYIVRHYMKIVTGLGLDVHRYELARRTTLDPDSDFTGGVVDSSGLSSFEKNKFRITYLQVPLLLEFNTSNYYKRTFHVAAGVIGQYRIGASTKQIVNSGGFEIKRKNSDDYNLNPFGLKAHVNFGYRGWTIYAEYSLTSLFKTGKGPELYPVTAGLRVIPFS